MKTKALKKQRALTLVEMIIMLAMMVVFVSALFSAMIAGLRYWNDGRMRLIAQEALRESLDVMTTELRQAIPNPDPGTNGNPPTGFKAIYPVVDDTGILFPNFNQLTGNYLEFTEPDENYYIPSGATWDPETPNNYQKIKYYVNGNKLLRHVTLYTESGAVLKQYQDELVTVPGLSLIHI